jgi:aminoglycoside 3-N-acetyltransferase I
VFELKPKSVPPAYLQELLNKDHFFVFVALDGTDVVGGLTAYALQQYVSVQPLMYVYDLAVKTEYQRLGIGKRLMGAIRHYSKEAGYEEVFVQAYAEEEQAVNFYHSS